MISYHRSQIRNEPSAKGPQLQLTKGWAVTEKMLDSLQLLRIETYPAIDRPGSPSATYSEGGKIGKRKAKRERDCTEEALAHLNQLKLIRSLWRALVSAFDTEFKPSKKPLLRVPNLLRAPTSPHRNICWNRPAGICFRSPSAIYRGGSRRGKWQAKG